MEKLIEEIAKMVLQRSTGTSLDWEPARCLAKRIVTRIGKAYADGMELPDEVGRIPADMLGGGKGEVVHVREGDTIIILRQEGTGRGEEK